MADTPNDDVNLVLGWDGLGASAGLRRNDTGFGTVKSMAEEANADNPLLLNAFLYAFLCPAKNFDLFLSENTGAIAGDIKAISAKMDLLSDFERDARNWPPTSLREGYLALRKVIARGTARDERRTLATLLFSGPSTSAQVAEDLGINTGLAERILRALAPVVERHDDEAYALRTDTDTLAAVLHLLGSTIGVDPLSILKRRIAANSAESG
ncbi:MAG: hypothetical protein ACR2QJ_17925 [Geminicoccaceae bacterium]